MLKLEQLLSVFPHAGFLLDFALRSTFVLALGYLLIHLLRRPAARQRAGEWALLAATLIPLISLLPMPVLSSWQIEALSPEEVPPIARSSRPHPSAADATDELRNPHSLDNADAESSALADLRYSNDTRSLPETAESNRESVGPLVVPSTQPQQPRPRTARSVAGLVWLLLIIGSGVTGMWTVVGYVKLTLMRNGSHAAPQHVAKVWEELMARSEQPSPSVQLAVSASVSQPLTFGLLRPVILLPTALSKPESCSPDALRMILVHELSHVRRHDARTWLLVGLANVLYFWHPLLWLIRRDLRLSQELIADATAARTANSPLEYAQHLLDIARLLVEPKKGPRPSMGIFSGKSELYRRVKVLMDGASDYGCSCSCRLAVSLATAFLLFSLFLGSVSVVARQPVGGSKSAHNGTTNAGQPATPLPEPKSSISNTSARQADPWLMRLGTDDLRHGDLPTSVAYSADGRWLVSAGLDSELRVWDSQTGRMSRRIEMGTSHGGTQAIAFSPNGSNIGVVGRNGALAVLNFATGETVFALEPSVNSYYEIVFSPDGKAIATGDHDGQVELRDSTSGELLQTFVPQLERAEGHRLAFSPDGKRLAGSGRQGEVCVWDIAEPAKPLLFQKVSENALECVIFLNDGASLLTRSTRRDTDEKLVGATQIWDAKTGELVRQIETRSSEIGSAVISPNGRLLATDERSSICIYDLSSGEFIRALEASADVPRRARSLSFDSSSSHLAACGARYDVRIWELATGRRMFHDDNRHQWSVGKVDVSADDKLYLTGGHDSVKIWDATNGTLIHSLRRTRETFGQLHDAKFVNSGKVVIAAWSGSIREAGTSIENGVIKTWDARTGMMRYELSGLPSIQGRLLFSQDETLFAAMSWHADDNESSDVIVFDTATGKRLGGLTLADKQYRSLLRLLPAQDRIELIDRDGNIETWDYETGRKVSTADRSIAGLVGESWQLVVMRDNDKGLLTSRRPTGIKVIDLNTLEVLHSRLVDHSTSLNVPAFSADGKLVVVRGSGSKLHIFDQELQSVCVIGHDLTALVFDLALSHDNKKLLCGLDDTTAVVLEIPRTGN